MALHSLSVSLTTCPSYKHQYLEPALDQILNTLAIPVTVRSSQVLLKPNLISAKAGPLACTEGAFILAVARRFIDLGAKVSIGDSPAFGTARSVLKNLNLLTDLRQLGVQIASFKQGDPVELPGGGQTVPHALLARAALECDLLVNMPRVKAHVQARLTLSIKNYFGCLVGLRKAWWHMAYGGKGGNTPCQQNKFFDRLIRIPAAFPSSLNIIDGIIAMHKSGPINGAPYPLSLLAASTNAVAADRALHEILRVQPERSPLMAACQRAELPGANLSHLSFPLVQAEKLQVDNFQLPEKLNPVRFNPFRFFTSSVRRFLLSRDASV
ncbi:DUF362 domain-containing protein [Candidatus Electrothrix sp.]|uniref:DUF362 domain-containing protein n=1 Tax=Candidatus Electrothrix sp. TaxID=2170559 RepID=UPI004055A34C